MIRKLTLMVVVPLLMAGVLAAAVSNLLWGYWFAPPPTLTEPTEDILWGVQYELDLTDGTIHPAPLPSLDEMQARYDREAIIYPVLRMPIAVLRGGEIATPNADTTQPIADTYADYVLNQPIEFGQGASVGVFNRVDYLPGRVPYGFLFLVEGESGEQRLLANLTSAEIVNDDYQYYEFRLGMQADGTLTGLSQQDFRYHIAGVEGIYFPALFGLFTVLIFTAGGMVLLMRGLFGEPPRTRRHWRTEG